jgi:membrane protease YdiL (CAAX protease family)
MEPESTAPPEAPPPPPTNAPAGPTKLQVVFFNERGLRAGWRLLIFAGLLRAAQGFLFWMLLLIRSGRNRPPQNATPPPEQLFIGEVVLFLVVVLITWVMSRIERRAMGTYGLPLRRSAWSSFFVGYLFWGFIPLTLLLLAMRGLGVFFIDGLALRGSDVAYFALVWGLVFLFVGLFEEYLTRGYPLYTLADGIGFWPAAVLMALVFGGLHMGNGGETRIGILDVCIFAMFASVTLRLTGNLWLAVGAHAGWDWGQSFFYGVNDSGAPAVGHLLNSHVKGPDWLSGGSVGPEGSVLSSLLQILMIAAFVGIYRGRRPALMITPAEEPRQPAQ